MVVPDKVRYTESIPVPDPSALTTALTQREVAALKEIIDTRIDAMDKAIALLQAFADKSPTTAAVAQSVESLEKLHAEKFKSIETQFKERDTRTEQMAKVSDLAVNAAFAAAKEAVGEQNKSNALSIAKSEAATAKQIDGILSSIITATKTSDDKFADLKDRLTAVESQKKGAGDMIAYLLAFGGLLVAAAAILFRG